jgi:3-hydroxybutyryl-CoA dehydrogenase
MREPERANADFARGTTNGRVLVVGFGTIGAAVAQLAMLGNYQVTVREADAGRLKEARTAMESRLRHLVTLGHLQEHAATRAHECLIDVAPAARPVPEVDFVVECVPEDFVTKAAVINEAVAISPGAVVMTTTSRLSITRLAAEVERPEQVVGTHFFVPAARMRLVEVTSGVRTSVETLERTLAFLRQLGKEPVVCRKDRPGFIASRAYAALRTECVRMVEEGLADPGDIDTVLRLGFNFPMGPFELADILGLDAYLQTLELLQATYGERFAPPPLLRTLVAAGRLGKKTGWGFYRYDRVVESQTAGDETWGSAHPSCAKPDQTPPFSN